MGPQYTPKLTGKVRESKRNLVFVCFWIPISCTFSHASVEVLEHAQHLLFMSMDIIYRYIVLSFGICVVTNSNFIKMYV